MWSFQHNLNTFVAFVHQHVVIKGRESPGDVINQSYLQSLVSTPSFSDKSDPRRHYFLTGYFCC